MSASNYEYYGFFFDNSKTIKSAPRIFCNHFSPRWYVPLNKFRHSDIWICKWKTPIAPCSLSSAWYLYLPIPSRMSPHSALRSSISSIRGIPVNTTLCCHLKISGARRASHQRIIVDKRASGRFTAPLASKNPNTFPPVFFQKSSGHLGMLPFSNSSSSTLHLSTAYLLSLGPQRRNANVFAHYILFLSHLAEGLASSFLLPQNLHSTSPSRWF